MVDELKAPRRRYGTGNDALDAKVAELVSASGHDGNSDLLAQMIASCFRLAINAADRGEMKLVNGALKEFVYAFKVFKAYRGARKVSIFGSSRANPDDPNYAAARHFAAALAARGWMVITGAGPGITEAGHEGAGAERSFGAAIRLPMEVEPNVVIEGDPKLINFKYFFTRKITFLKESHAFALFPGGFGTLDEAFELLTLIQTGKSDLHPVVCLEAEGGTYWQDFRRFMVDHLLARGLISQEDLDLVFFTDSAEAAIREIEGFYRNYQSQRYVDGTLVLRLLRLPPDAALDEMAGRYADIIAPGSLKAVDAYPQEVAEDDELECRRIALGFNQSNFGRLRQLINELNRY